MRHFRRARPISNNDSFAPHAGATDTICGIIFPFPCLCPCRSIALSIVALRAPHVPQLGVLICIHLCRFAILDSQIRTRSLPCGIPIFDLRIAICHHGFFSLRAPLCAFSRPGRTGSDSSRAVRQVARHAYSLPVRILALSRAPPSTPTNLPNASATPTKTTTPDLYSRVKPGAPLLVSPASNAKLKTLAVALDWIAVPCADQYRIIVRMDSAAGEKVVKKKVKRTDFLTGALTPSRTYYRQVKACNGTLCSAGKMWKFNLKKNAK